MPGEARHGPAMPDPARLIGRSLRAAGRAGLDPQAAAEVVRAVIVTVYLDAQLLTGAQHDGYPDLAEWLGRLVDWAEYAVKEPGNPYYAPGPETAG